jgi:predicted phosphoadenosine phosphosulfate sulfurtransferase
MKTISQLNKETWIKNRISEIEYCRVYLGKPKASHKELKSLAEENWKDYERFGDQWDIGVCLGD